MYLYARTPIPYRMCGKPNPGNSRVAGEPLGLLLRLRP